MGIKPLLDLVYSILINVFSSQKVSGTSKSGVPSSTSGQESESLTSLEKLNLEKSPSARFLTFVSQSIFFETGGDRSGAYTNDPSDSGGETKWGISKRAHPHLNIKAVTYNQAVDIYRTQYWNDNYDYILSDMLCFKLFDMGILNGPSTAVKLLQRSIRQCGLHIAVDTSFGPLTLTAINNIKPEELYEKYINLFDTRFRRLVIRVRKNQRFLQGWLNRLNWKWSV